MLKVKCVHDCPKEGFHPNVYPEIPDIRDISWHLLRRPGLGGASHYCTTTSCFAAASTADTFQNIDVTAGSLGDSYTDPTGLEFTDSFGLTGVVSLAGCPGGTAITASNTGANTINVLFPSGVDAIEFYADAQLQYSDVYVSVTDSSGTIETTLYEASAATPLFFGVTTTDSTFTSFSISTDFPNPAQVALGDIFVGSGGPGPGDPSPTPEAATLLLVATGLFMMSYFRRRTFAEAANRGRKAAEQIAQAASRGTVRTMSTGITPA